MTRGYKNCNPGNIEQNRDLFQGEVRPSQDKRFKQFRSMAYGYRAMFVTLATYNKRGLNSIDKIIRSWAPSIENHTDKYIECVERWSGVNRHKILTLNSSKNYIEIVAAMSRMENGVIADRMEVLKGFKLQERIQ